MHILWIPHTGWHIPQRAHLFCRALAELHEIHVTDWVADFYHPVDYFSRRYMRNLTYRQYRDGLIYVHGIPRLSPALYSRTLRRWNTQILSRFVARIIARYHIEVVVGSFLMPPPVASRVVFDWFDENVLNWRYSSRVPNYADEIEATEGRYLQAADEIVVASSVLGEKARSLGARGFVHLIPNAVDLQRFNHADSDRLRAELKVQGPIVGIVGNHDHAPDVFKLLDAAEALRDRNLTFLIAGRGAALSEIQTRAKQAKLHNLRFLGYVPPDQMPDVVAAFDVGLCLYAKTPTNDARSPMRLLAYAAAGVPAVCTDLSEARRLAFSNVILIQDDVRSLVEGILHALQLPHGQPPQIAEYDIRRLAPQYESVLAGQPV